MSRKKLYMNWSTGKDSALALYYLQQDKNLSIEHLLTSVNAHHNRVSMHGLRRELMIQQAQATGIPISTIELPEQPGMNEYETLMKKYVSELKSQGYDDTAFGDIFLEDLRLYREKQLVQFKIKAHFPLWKKNTDSLLKEFIDLGFKAIVVCVKSELLDESFAGREINAEFISDLPSNVDPCGENGEFHTFCFDGPVFNKPIRFKTGEKIYREYEAPRNQNDSCPAPLQQKNGFWFCDLLSE